jgi:hypothetical protein
MEDFNKCYTELLEALDGEEREYILGYYKLKEYQFCRIYTRTYLNLSVNSTRRSESYHIVVKDKLHCTC